MEWVVEEREYNEFTLVVVVVRQPMGGWVVLKGCLQQTKNSW